MDDTKKAGVVPAEPDKNMTPGAADADGILWYEIKSAPFEIYGLCEPQASGDFCRMPDDVAATVNPGVHRNARHTAGGRKYGGAALPVVYYGSSITQGACASRPGLAYQAIISRRLDLDFINLGFSGNARAEDTMVEYMASLEMSAFVSDYDHNAPTVDHLRATHLRMYRKIRESHPNIPYIMLSRPDFASHSEADSERRRRVIEDTFRAAREAGDKRVWYIDGEGIYRGFELDACTVDNDHPTDLGFMKMADAIGRILRRAMRQGL